MKKGTVDNFQPKITRNDRFAQMSHQEKIIEQKKKEILAKLQSKKPVKETDTSKSTSSSSKGSKSSSKSQDNSKKSSSSSSSGGINMFSNDGSFLDTFKHYKDKRFESKLKSFKAKDNAEKNCSEDRSGKSSRWSQRRRSPSPKDRSSKQRISRFSEKSILYEPKITINTSFATSIPQQNYETQQNFEAQSQQIVVSPQNVTGQPLLKNILPTQNLTFQSVLQTTAPVIAAPPLLLNVPPPQLVQNEINTTMVVAQPQGTILATTPSGNVQIPQSVVLTTVTLPAASIITSQATTVTTQNTIPITVELASIPPPNPIQVQNIPQPDPINTLNIPPPAPIQVQNIPTPSSIQLNEIPNPKPLDLLAIPTPNDENISDPEFLKSIPPPNKAVPPPNLPENNVLTQSVKVQATATCLAHANLLNAQTSPIQQTITVQNVGANQNVVLHNIPPSSQVQTLQQGNNFTTVSSISVALPVGIVPSTQQATVTNTIPSLMAQPILPPPGMNIGPQHININCPPPLLPVNATIQTSALNFINQPPMIPSMNIPPPSQSMPIVNQNVSIASSLPDMHTGTPDYEAMASLGRMVAQCGPGIEDIVRQRKPQDPSLWFLFHKDSAAYHQYAQLIEQFKKESFAELQIKSEDVYEPEMATGDIDYSSSQIKDEIKEESSQGEGSRSRKRRSRWGDKDTSIPPPTIFSLGPSTIGLPQQVVPIQQFPTGGEVMLSKITRTDKGLVQYAVNTFGSANLTEEEWKKAEDHYKINLLYQDMVKKREELQRIQRAGRNKYDYDSDEETDGGTWEHKLRDKEMMATQLWAQELNRQAEGKHHIGDFLPPDELKRFMEKSSAVKEGRQPNFSDYKEFKIKEDNIGFKMLQKLGWSEGEGLGSKGSGIVEPVNKAIAREQNQGLGLGQSDENEDEYESYRKRMMLAYRFRPNPLNNPRRPYY